MCPSSDLEEEAPLVRVGPYGGIKRKPAVLKELAPRHRLMLEYMVNGCSKPILCQKIKRPPVVDPYSGEVLKPAHSPSPGEPLQLFEAAEIAGIKKRHARELSGLPIFQREMAKEVQKLRTGAQAKAMQTVIGLVSEEGQGKAADRKVQLAASLVVLGETGQSGGATVNVNVGVQNNISPGYIIKPPSRSVTINGLLSDNERTDVQASIHPDDVEDD